MTSKFERPEILRPPSEARSYYLPLTNGCSNHDCTFCRYYGCKLTFRDLEDVKREIDAMYLYYKSGVMIPGIPQEVYYFLKRWDGNFLFLQDGDALVYPYPKLKETLEYLNSKFPNIERIASYASPVDLLHKSVEQLQELKKLKIGILYLGVETGDEQLLGEIGKNVNYAQMVEAGRKVKQAGIILSVSVLLGLGGQGGSKRHALATAKILSDIDPEYAGALTLTVIPGTPLYEKVMKGEFKMITPFQSLEELRIMVENINVTNCFFSSVHASNYLTVRGILPGDKEKMLRQIDSVLASGDPSLLRPEYLRGL